MTKERMLLAFLCGCLAGCATGQPKSLAPRLPIALAAAASFSQAAAPAATPRPKLVWDYPVPLPAVWTNSYWRGVPSEIGLLMFDVEMRTNLFAPWEFLTSTNAPPVPVPNLKQGYFRVGAHIETR